MRSPRRLTVVAAFVALSACGLPEQVPVMEARLGPDGRTLELGVGSCNAEHTVDVDEQAADEVTVTVTAAGDDGNDCMDGVTVVLQEKLGDRVLVDGSTGEVVGIL